MGLLETLQLPTPAALKGAPPIQPMPVMNITETQGAEVSANGARPIAVKAAEPAGLKARLEARDKALRDAYARIAKAQEKLDERIAGLGGSAKATAQAQKQDLDKALAGIDRQLKQNDADRKALASPATDARAMNEILARSKEPVGAGRAVEVDRHDDALTKKWSENRETTTTTGLKNGRSTTKVADESTRVGPDGVTKTRTDASDTVTAQGRTSTATTRTTRVGTDGASHEVKETATVEAKGRTSSLETRKGVKAGPDGVSVSKETKLTAGDGSSSSTTVSGKGERGDGKIGASASAKGTRADAEGNEKSGNLSGKGGLSSGPDGAVGAYAGGEGGVQNKNKGGDYKGLVGGLDAAITCNVQPKGARYEVSLRVNLGASIKLTTGHEKEGGAVKAGGSVSHGETVWMSNSWLMEAGEVPAFVAALKGGGGAVNGTERELAIVRKGLAMGWAEAQKMYTGVKVGSAEDVAGMRAGDSKSIGRKSTTGLGVDADVKGVGVSASSETSDEREMKVTKDADGGTTYDTQQGQGRKREVGGKVSVGVVEGGGSIGKVVTTKTGYKFRVKPEADPAVARQLQDRIAALAEAPQAEVDAFAKAHAGDKNLVIERTDTRDETDTNKVTAGVGGVKGTFTADAGVETTVRRDAQGNIIDTRKAGHNAGGLALEAGGRTIGASHEEKLAGREAADGERVVDVTRDAKETDAVKFLDSLPLVGSQPHKKDDAGALAKASGGQKADTDTRSVAGMTLTQDDLKGLGQAAKAEGVWIKACNDPDDMADWEKARRAIAKAGGSPEAVENALAEFVGGNNQRQAIVQAAMRGKAGDVQGGKAWEFPDSIRTLQAEYQELVLAACEKKIAATAKTDAGEAQKLGNAYLGRLESLQRGVRSATDFKQTDVKGEMLSAIASRQSRVGIELRKLGGLDEAAAEKAEERKDYERLLEACINHQQEETGLFDKIDAETKRHSKAEAARNIVPITVQIKNLHATWKKDYDRLAMLAQENNWGENRYWKFKPDAARLDHAVKTFTPGVASKPEAEKKDLKRDPNAVSEKRKGEINQELNKSDWQKYNEIKKGVESTRQQCKTLGDELQALLKKAPYPTVKQFVDQAEAVYERAEAKVLECRPNYMDDMFDLGLGALEEFRQSLALLKKAKGFVPKSHKG